MKEFWILDWGAAMAWRLWHSESGQIGGGYSSGHSDTQSFYKPAVPAINQFIPVMQRLLGLSDPTGGPGVAAGEAELLKEPRGGYTDPATDPALAPVAEAIKREAGDYLQQNLANEDRTANQGGMLLSTKNAQMKDVTTRDSAKDVADRLASLYQGEYDTERSRQGEAASNLINLGDFNWQQALELLRTFGGMGQSKSSNVSISGSV